MERTPFAIVRPDNSKLTKCSRTGRQGCVFWKAGRNGWVSRIQFYNKGEDDIFVPFWIPVVINKRRDAWIMWINDHAIWSLSLVVPACSFEHVVTAFQGSKLRNDMTYLCPLAQRTCGNFKPRLPCDSWYNFWCELRMFFLLLPLPLSLPLGPDTNIPTTYRPHTNHNRHIPIAFTSHIYFTEHISMTYRPHTDDIPITCTDHIPTIYRPHTNHIPTTYRSDQLVHLLRSGRQRNRQTWRCSQFALLAE